MFGDQEVLHGIDLSVERGQLTGFLGPNGAGKTTTIRILLGLIRRTGGMTRLFGDDSAICGPALRRRIGYLPADVRFPADLTGRHAARLYARARRLNCDSQIDRLADELDLELDKKIRKYSTGMKQKLGLIQALMHQPELLVLDEPTTGLDPLVREAVFRELRQFVSAGGSILFSSHSLGEVEQLCDRVIILRDGCVIENQTIDALRKRALRRVSIEFCDGSEVPSRNSFPDGLQAIRFDGLKVNGTWSDPIGQFVQWLSPFGISDVTIEQPDLEDLFMTYYSESVESMPNGPTK